MNRLLDYFETNNRRQIFKWMHYFEIYDRHFSKFRDKEITLVEIGVYNGGSLQMWKDYFGPKVTIHGIDIDEKSLQIAEDRIQIHIGSQSDRNFLRELKAKIPVIDILIDDGGHTMEQQIVTFEELFPHISESGLYVCEDLHTSYWPDYGGGYKKANTFIEYSKNFIDKIHGFHSWEVGVDSFTSTAKSLHFYDSMLVIEKGFRNKPICRTTGPETIR